VSGPGFSGGGFEIIDHLLGLLKTYLNQRNLHIDALRGYCLLAMTIDHLKVPGLWKFTSGTFGVFDAAAGFIFISGLVAGGYYLKVAERSGEAATTSRALGRSGVIYLTHFAVAALILGLIMLHQAHTAGGGRSAGIGVSIPGLSPGETFFATLTLIKEPPLLEVLPLYVFLMMLVPILVKSWTRRWITLALCISAGIWLLSQPGVLLLPFLPNWMKGGDFNIFSWQFLFVCAFVLGCLHRTQNFPLWFRSRATWIFLLVPFAVFLALRHSEFFPPLSNKGTGLLFGNWWDSKATLGPLCIVDFAIFAFLVVQVFENFGGWLEKTAIHRYLRFIGQHSLQVYVWSLLIVCSLPFVYKASGIAGSRNGRCAFGMIGVLSLYIPAWLHKIYRNRKAIPVARPGSSEQMLAVQSAENVELPSG
jgi:hypothetical protein